jgi:hypothetical protein
MLPVEDILSDAFNGGTDLPPPGHGEFEGGSDPQRLAVNAV